MSSATLIKQTETMQALLRNTEKEPARLLAAICRAHVATGRVVVDHYLNLAFGDSGEAMCRALLSSDLIAGESGDRSALYGYGPTDVGRSHYGAMSKEKIV